MVPQKVEGQPQQMIRDIRLTINVHRVASANIFIRDATLLQRKTYFLPFALLIFSLPSLTREVPAVETRGLGTAYKSDSVFPLLLSSCVTGQTKSSLTGGSSVTYARDSSFEDMLKAISGSIDVGIDVPVFGAFEGAAGFAWQHASTKNSNSWNYVFRAQTRTESFVQGSEGMSDVLRQRIEADPEVDFYEKCGDEYISEIDYGASLVVSLVADFLREKSKTQVGGRLAAKFELGGVIKAQGEGELDLEFGAYNDEVKVRVVVNQFGGDHAKLASVLKNQIVDCKLSNIAACENTLKSILDYANSDFVTQIKEGSEHVLRYRTAPYRQNLSLDTLEGKSRDTSSYVSVAREHLLEENRKYREMYTRAMRLTSLWKDFLLDNQMYEAIEQLKLAVLRNIKRVTADLAFCSRDAPQCLSLTFEREEMDESLLSLTGAQTPLEMLFEAARNGDVERIFTAIKVKQANSSLANLEGQKSIHVAAANGKADAVRALIEYEPGLVNAKDSKQQSPLCYAIASGEGLAVEALLDNQADTETLCAVAKEDGISYRLSPLKAAAYLGREQVLTTLIRRGIVDIYSTDAHGRNTLHWAVLGSQIAVVRVLLKQMKDISSLEAKEPTAHELATEFQRREIADYLSGVAQEELLGKVRTGSLNQENCQLLLKYGASVDKPDSKGRLPLHEAANENQVEAIAVLVRHGAMVNAANAQGQSALHIAVAQGHADSVKALLGASALPNLADLMTGETPLHYAVKAKNAKILNLLVDAGADPLLPDRDGTTSSLLAEWYNFGEFREVLQKLKPLTLGASNLSCEGEPCTNLKEMFDVVSSQDDGSLKRMYALLARGVDVNALLKDLPLLHFALKLKQSRKAFALIQSGAHINVMDKEGFVPLHIAAAAGDETNVEALLSKGAEVDATDASGYSPLWYALANGQVRSAALLIQYGANFWRPEIKRHRGILKESPSWLLLQKELDQGHLQDEIITQHDEVVPNPMQVAECESERKYWLEKGCITNGDFFKLTQRGEFPICSMKNVYKTSHPCGMIYVK